MKILFLFSWLLTASTHLLAQDHPNLILNRTGVQTIQRATDKAPLFDWVVSQTIKEVDAEIEAGIFVPVPKDMAGGYTHERHKKNFFILQKAGNLYQITGEEKYARYIRAVFMAYAELYPTLGLHPTMKSYATGKIFWQCLNDANWLVYCSQAYDCIYNYLKPDERQHLENQLFRPLADFISKDNPKFFNRIHNHSTWGNAAVGMIGLVMKDEELIERALYGLKNDGLDNSMLDNDGGFIKVEGQNQAGFLAQLDFSFSPDGYFTEGPYYLRYAMTPFLLFAKALANNRPDLKIYAYRDRILQKAVDALLNQTDAQGQFFPINDAQKGMSWKAREVIAALDIAYHDFGQNPMLLSVADLQGRVTLDQMGYRVAVDLEKGLAEKYIRTSQVYRDGSNGQKGGVAILRNESPQEEELCVVMKYSAHGMGHGHFDKLSYSLYNEDGEVIQDYGAARWVNIDQKGGGRYLPENNTFAKQSIAHNTMVLNENSHYDGSVKKGEAHHPNFYCVVKDSSHQVISAKDRYAYPGTTMHRTLLLLTAEEFRLPLLIDIFKVDTDTLNQYDLPLWFQGHVLATNFDFTRGKDQLKPLGEAAGYQHLWKEAEGHPSEECVQLTWMEKGKFYTLTSLTQNNDQLIFARAGANDPNFNLRPDPVFIHRRPRERNSVFVSAIESHGTYDPVSEIPIHPFPSLKSIDLIHESTAYTVIRINHQSGKSWTIALAHENAATEARHQVQVADQNLQWTGPILIE